MMFLFPILLLCFSHGRLLFTLAGGEWLPGSELCGEVSVFEIFLTWLHYFTLIKTFSSRWLGSDGELLSVVNELVKFMTCWEVCMNVDPITPIILHNVQIF